MDEQQPIRLERRVGGGKRELVATATIQAETEAMPDPTVVIDPKGQAFQYFTRIHEGAGDKRGVLVYIQVPACHLKEVQSA